MKKIASSIVLIFITTNKKFCKLIDQTFGKEMNKFDEYLILQYYDN